MTTEDDVLTENSVYDDQLVDVQDFGGDRNSVTVLGHGTGAACLHYLMTSDALPHGEIFGQHGAIMRLVDCYTRMLIESCL